MSTPESPQVFQFMEDSADPSLPAIRTIGEGRHLRPEALVPNVAATGCTSLAAPEGRGLGKGATGRGVGGVEFCTGAWSVWA